MRPAQTEWIATALAVEKYKVSSRTLYSCKKQGFMTTKKIGSITTWSVAELDSRFKKRTS